MKIGLEIHIQLKTTSKLFCPCSTNYWNAKPNTNVCPVCLGLPGAKPFPVNTKALKQAVKIALALGMKINDKVTFLRKHYFYPDLPSGYQRTSTPLATDGRLGKIRIRELHIEEDPGRYEPREGVVDFNRSGIPLVEIVTEPDMNSPEEAEEFLRQLHLLLTYLDVVLNPSIVFRVDANVSIPGGERVEIKNINSVESVKKAIKYEVLRQRRLLEMGKKVIRETRHWDEVRGVTVSLRTKETEEDYRYIPDPDIPPVEVKHIVEEVKEEIPELPWEREERFIQQFGLSQGTAHTLILEKEMADFFETNVKYFEPKFWASFLADRLKGELNYRYLTFKDVRDREGLLAIAKAWANGKITKEVAVEALRALLDGKPYRELLEASEIDVGAIVDKVIKENKKVVEDYLNGRKAALNRLIGEVMKRTRGRADARKVKELLLQRLGKG